MTIKSDNLSLSTITIYPIKSLNGVERSLANIQSQGIENDRLMMLVDENGLFITQRKYPQLALIFLSVVGNDIHLAADDLTTLIINNASFKNDYQLVRIWKDQSHAQIADEKINQWFSDYLKQNVKLVRYDHQRPRPANPKYSKPNDIVSFADGFPLLVISEASLVDLNQRLSKPVSMLNFRTNLIVTGGHAFQEDSWKTIIIGDVVFDVVKRCDRCILTTIDPKTGLKSPSREPLKMLESYRSDNDKTYFGMNLIPRNLGTIKKNSTIEILD